MEHEQSENLRSDYGNLSYRKYQTGCSRNLGRFFRSELFSRWKHYWALLRVENEEARQWYMDEAVACAWSGWQLECQISTLYYERILSSREKEPVENEAKELLEPLAVEEFIKDEAIVKYSVLNKAKQVFASKYRFTLPAIEELQCEIEEERRKIEGGMDI